MEEPKWRPELNLGLLFPVDDFAPLFRRCIEEVEAKEKTMNELDEGNIMTYKKNPYKQPTNVESNCLPRLDLQKAWQEGYDAARKEDEHPDSPYQTGFTEGYQARIKEIEALQKFAKHITKPYYPKEVTTNMTKEQAKAILESENE